MYAIYICLGYNKQQTLEKGSVFDHPACLSEEKKLVYGGYKLVKVVENLRVVFFVRQRKSTM